MHYQFRGSVISRYHVIVVLDKRLRILELFLPKIDFCAYRYDIYIVSDLLKLEYQQVVNSEIISYYTLSWRVIVVILFVRRNWKKLVKLTQTLQTRIFRFPFRSANRTTSHTLYKCWRTRPRIFMHELFRA